jgi:hypothetical protein
VALIHNDMSMIDKTNKLWKWKKASKKFKEQYEIMTGLEAKEIGTPTKEYFDLLERIYGINT